MTDHDYLSTACLHGACGNCRKTCKFCDSPCLHGCHPAQPQPPGWTDQAREVAVSLLAAVRSGALPATLAARIERDPALFWLRGETEPVGVWRDPGMAPETRAGIYRQQRAAGEFTVNEIREREGPGDDPGIA